MNNNQNTDNNIARYFSGELSKNELFELEKVLRETPESAEQFEKAKRVWYNLYSPGKANKNVIAKKTIQKIHLPYRKHFLLRTLNYAAIFLLVVMVSGSIIWFYNTKSGNIVLVETTVGEVKKIILADSTIVWLNAKSSLEYKEPFSKKERKVYFKGEAFFDVKSDKKHPFTVETDNVLINVVGTRFNVSSYGNDPTEQTFLEEGKISIKTKILDKSFSVSPSQLVTFNKTNNNVVIEPGTVQRHVSWLDGGLSFYNERFDNIARKLERKFGVKIIIQNEIINQLKYTAQFVDEDIDEVLEFLSGTYTIEIQTKDNIYYITQKQSNN